MVLWDDRFCETLAERGFYVIRFDNRDVGRSTILRELGIPSRTQLFVRDRRGAKYSLDDMAGDAAGLMRELDFGSAHVVGVSMGGMIAQTLAIQHPRRVRSLVSIMSSTGNRRVGQALPRLWPRMLRRVRRDREGYIRDFIETYQTIGSTLYPPDPARMRTACRAVLRTWPAPVGRRATARGDHHRRRPDAIPAGARCPHHGHPRHRRSAGEAVRRSRHRRRDPGRAAVDARRDGARHAAGAVAADHRRDLRERRRGLAPDATRRPARPGPPDS